MLNIYFNIMLLVLLFSCCLVSNGMTLVLESDSEHGIQLNELAGGTIDVLIRHERSTQPTLVDISRFIDKPRNSRKSSYSAFVDNTMERLIFIVTTEGSNPAINVTTPSGDPFVISPIFNTTNNITTALIDIPINETAHYGEWKFARSNTDEWNVTIQGESPVYITHELFDVGSNETLEEMPKANGQYTFLVTVFGMSENDVKVEKLQLYALSNRQLAKLISSNVLGNDTIEAKDVPILYLPFFIGIEGTDNSSNKIQRIDPQLIHPVTVGIEIPSFDGLTLYENAVLNINYTVTSYYKAANHIEVGISDTAYYVREPKSANFTLTTDANDTGTGVFVLRAGPAGTSTTVTISTRFISSRAGRPIEYSDGSKVVRTFTVAIEDSSSPVGAIVGGLFGSSAAVSAVVAGVFGFRKFIVPRMKVRQDDDKEKEQAVTKPE